MFDIFAITADIHDLFTVPHGHTYWINFPRDDQSMVTTHAAYSLPAFSLNSGLTS